MSVRKSIIIRCLLSISLCAPVLFAATPQHTDKPLLTSTFTQPTLADQLGWIPKSNTECGGFYVEKPFVYPIRAEENKRYVEVTSNESVFAQNGTSILEGNVSVTRYGQQLKANRAYLYRYPDTHKLSNMDLIGNVVLREPNTLVVAARGNYNFTSGKKTLQNLLYRTSLTNTRQVIGPNISDLEIENERVINADMIAWGKASQFAQAEPRVYELSGASFTTCAPIKPAWHVKTSHLVLNKNNGRGYATNLRLYVKSVPVFYFPYVNFSIDRKRKSGFLWPTFGWQFIELPGTNRQVPSYYLHAPIYLNLAPNYDMTFTPGIFTSRGLQLEDKFRYLTKTSTGNFYVSVLPNDRMFADFQDAIASDPTYSQSSDSTIQAEFNRTLSASDTRKGISWKNSSVLNSYWSSNILFNYVSDDYYLNDLGGVDSAGQNQLLQLGDVTYEGQHWNFIGRLQTYQTLHPINAPAVINQYRRLPQLVLNGNYPDQPYGLDFFINNEATHFSILNTPGTTQNQPIGNRYNTQPGVSLPLYWPYFYMNPRAQVALTAYSLYQTTPTDTPTLIKRAVPIFDVAAGSTFVRNAKLFNYHFRQTLEPQAYYTYIPYHNQDSIPVFDTTVNTLTYDQLFNYNRFSGIDRIGDANQIGIGIATRMIDDETGEEKIRLGAGEIVYFSNRRVTLCDDLSCTDNPTNDNNRYSLSPLSAILNYKVNPLWSLNSTAIWSPISKQLGNSTIALHYETDNLHILNLAFQYVFNGDIQSGTVVNTAQNNIKLTDFSFSWPLYTHSLSAVGRWTQSWNDVRLQNLLYGVQYDTCCWAVRAVGGTSFNGIDPTNDNKPKYTANYYIEFALKGLGNIGTGSTSTNPKDLLGAITGYDTKFGQEF